jgi:hypothetical protein
MFKYLRKVINKKYYNKNNVLLGRWATLDHENLKNRRSILANIDSCGHELCSNPFQLRKKLGYYEYRSKKEEIQIQITDNITLPVYLLSGNRTFSVGIPERVSGTWRKRYH